MISFDFPSTLIWPRTRPEPGSNACTRCSADLLEASKIAPFSTLPSIAT